MLENTVTVEKSQQILLRNDLTKDQMMEMILFGTLTYTCPVCNRTYRSRTFMRLYEVILTTQSGKEIVGHTSACLYCLDNPEQFSVLAGKAWASTMAEEDYPEKINPQCYSVVHWEFPLYRDPFANRINVISAAFRGPRFKQESKCHQRIYKNGRPLGQIS